MALIATSVTVACYSYLPLTTPNPAPGSAVAVTLTDAGTLELGRYLGFDVHRLRGRYLGGDEHQVTMAVAIVETKHGDWTPWAGESVSIPMAHVASVDQRRLAKGRTFLLAGAGIAGVLTTALAFTLAGRGTSPSTTRPPPPPQ